MGFIGFIGLMGFTVPGFVYGSDFVVVRAVPLSSLPVIFGFLPGEYSSCWCSLGFGLDPKP